MSQKFHKYDLVRIAKSLGSFMDHFTADCNAIVIGSYADQFGGGDTRQYTIYVKGCGRISWYEEHQLELIERNQSDLLNQWELDDRADDDEKSNIDWIFMHGHDVLKIGHGRSVEALAKCFGCNNLWGSRGEGFVYYQNALQTLAFAAPYLLTGDKDGYLKKCDEIKAQTN